MKKTTPGYRAILIQDTTFNRLKRFWRDGDDRDENALARIATAFIELGLQTETHLAAARLTAKQLHLLERMQELPATNLPHETRSDFPALTPRHTDTDESISNSGRPLW